MLSFDCELDGKVVVVIVLFNCDFGLKSFGIFYFVMFLKIVIYWGGK